MNQIPAPLAEIRITDELAVRPPGPRDLAAENQAFVTIARSLGGDAADALRALTEAGRLLCRAGSCGVSLLEPAADGDAVFRWVSLSGALAAQQGKSTPAGFSPCGVCLRYATPQLFAYPGRHYRYFDEVAPRIIEGLVIPFMGRAQVMGTIWIVAHDDTRFTLSDVIVMQALADFTAAAIVLQNEERVIRGLLERERLAREQAQEANRAKDLFLATVSHELRTPLNAVMGWADVLANGDASSRAASPALSAIQDNTLRLARLVDDLLDASRGLSHELKLTTAVVDLRAVLLGAVHSAAAAAAERGLRLETELGDAAAQVLGDEMRITQVFANLLDNALKFTPRGGVIRVELSPDTDQVIAQVTDSGIGIGAEFLPQVFEPFSQAETDPGRRKGFGLGLSISSDIVARHGGRITAASGGAQQGSRFTVSFPRAEEVTRAPVVAVEVAPAIAGMRVLIVDDHRDGREALAAMLAQHGASVRTADSAAAALEVLRQREVDVLLADIVMPDHDGFTLMAELQSLQRSSGAKIRSVAVTALTSPADRARVLAAGFDVHLPKPVRTGALLSSLAQLRLTSN